MFTALAAYSTASGIGHNSCPLANPAFTIMTIANPSRTASSPVSINLRRKSDALSPRLAAPDEAALEESRAFAGIVPFRECALARVLRDIQYPLPGERPLSIAIAAQKKQQQCPARTVRAAAASAFSTAISYNPRTTRNDGGCDG
jgi:hypothetical protein